MQKASVFVLAIEQTLQHNALFLRLFLHEWRLDKAMAERRTIILFSP